MTAKKDLKRRIRERQQQTGESYVAARRAIVGEQLAVVPDPAPEPAPASPPAIEVDEMDDLTPEATALGMRCSVSISRHLSAHVEPQVALARLRDAVQLTTADPGMEAFRAVVLRGELPTRPLLSADWMEQLRTFVARVRAGIGGISEGGSMLALPVDGRDGSLLMVCQLGFGMVRRAHQPRVVLTSANAMNVYVEPIAMRALRKAR